MPPARQQPEDVAKFIENVRRNTGEEKFFQPGKTVYINRTPGRLDLMGGNDDYTGGLVFETTIREATLAAVQSREDRRVRFLNPAVKTLGWQDLVEFSLDDVAIDGKVRPLDVVRNWINSDPNRSWCAYILGDVYFLIKKFPGKISHGFDLYLESDVPLGKGVSSSAALEIAPMKAAAAMYGIHAAGVELAAWTQWVEIALTQSACGIMDQTAVILGEEDAFVPMLCQPSRTYPLAKLPGNLRIWGIDSGVRHAVSGIEYEAARAATFIGYRYLCDWEGLVPTLDESGALPRWVESKWNGYLANLTPALFRTLYEDRLPEKIIGGEFNRKYPVHLDPFTPVRDDVTYPVKAAVRYAVEENWRVNCFFRLISKSDHTDEATARLLGELMYLSHVGYSQCGLGSPATDKIIEFVRAEEKNGLLGAKITGGGAGGTVAILGFNTQQAEGAFQNVVLEYTNFSSNTPYLFKGSSDGCDKFGVIEV